MRAACFASRTCRLDRADGLPSAGCGALIAEREFPSDKVYRRDDRGIVGVQPSARIASRSMLSMVGFDAGQFRAVPSWGMGIASVGF
jgi:hypothetical protein